MLITCGTCNGDGFVSFGDRHVENRKEVCGECKGLCMVEARTGDVPQASASPDGTSLYADSSRRHTRVVGIDLGNPSSQRGVHPQPAAQPPVAKTLTTPPVWSYDFEEMGGYDACSSAYVIRENGEDRIVVDVVNMPDFNHKNCYDKAEWEEAHRRYDSAESLAQRIVRALNFETPPNKPGD